MLLGCLTANVYGEDLSDSDQKEQLIPSVSSQTPIIRPLTVIRQIAKFQAVDRFKPFEDYWFSTNRIIDVDLSKEPGFAYSLSIGDKTKFTKTLPQGYSPEKLIEWGKYAGLNIDILHKHGFTGKGAVIAYIDQPIGDKDPTYHEQYASSTLHYINNTKSESSMHGPAVLSLLLGKDIGTAPEAEVYFYGFASWEGDQLRHSEALYQIIEQNKKLPDNKKIRMVGFSDNIVESEKNPDAFREAVKACEDAGIMVWFCGDYGAYSFIPYSDKNSLNSLVSESWWSSNQPDLVCVPSAGRTTAAIVNRTKYIYWANGGLSWAMPYVLGLYAIAIEINPSLTKNDLSKMIVDTAYINNDAVPIVNPIGFVASALKSVGRDSEAQVILDEAKARTKYFYAVMNTSTMTEQDLTAVGDYLANFTDATVLTVDTAKISDIQSLYTTLQNDSKQRGGKVAGIQIFGTASMVPSFKIKYKAKKVDGSYEGGFLLTDLFYGNFDSDVSKLNSEYNVEDHMANGWNVDLIPQWPVARLPLSKGEFDSFFKRYKAFAVDTNLNQLGVVSFSNLVPYENRLFNDMGCFLCSHLDYKHNLLDAGYRLYCNDDEVYYVFGNFELENMTKENKRDNIEFVIKANGQFDRIDKTSFDKGWEQFTPLVNMDNINSVFSANPYYLDTWRNLNGYDMENNLTTTALNGKCVGAFSATSNISSITFNLDESFKDTEYDDFYNFFYNYFKAIHDGETRSQAFFIAQKEYGKTLISSSKMPISEDKNYQLNLYNLIAYHNFGVIEPNVVALSFCESEGYINKTSEQVKKLRKDAGKISWDWEKFKLTDGKPVGKTKKISYDIKNKLTDNKTGTIHSFTAQPLDNGYMRFSIEYSVPENMEISVFNKPKGNFIAFRSDEQKTPKDKGRFEFDLSNESLAKVSEICVRFTLYPETFTLYFKPDQFK